MTFIQTKIIVNEIMNPKIKEKNQIRRGKYLIYNLVQSLNGDLFISENF